MANLFEQALPFLAPGHSASAAAVTGNDLGDPIGIGAAEDAAAAAAAAAEFDPYNIQTGLGTASFADGTATAALSPELQGFYDQLLGGSSAALSAAQEFDPYQAAEGLFGRMEGILAPGRERERAQLESRLLSQGRLGSTGGMFDQQAQQGAVEAQRQNYLNQAFGQAQQVQQGLFSQGMQGLQGATALQQLAAGQIGTGGTLGSAQSQAAIGAGNFATQGASLWPSFMTGLISGGIQGAATGGMFGGGGGSTMPTPAYMGSSNYQPTAGVTGMYT